MTAPEPGRAPEREPVLRSTANMLLTYAGTAGLTAVLTLYLVRALGPTDFGVLSLALGIAGLLSLPMDFGIGASAARFMAERTGDREALAALFAAAMRLKLIVAGSVALLLALLAGVVADAYNEPALEWPLRAVALATAMQSLVGLFSAAFIAVGQTRVNLRMIMSESVVEVGATASLVALGGGAGGAATGRAVGYVAGAIIGLALAVRLFGRRAAAAHRPGGERMMTMGRYALTLWLVNGVYTIFNQLDVLVIGALLSTAAVGAFSAPLQLTYLLYYPGLAVGNSVAPLVARREGEPPDVEAVAKGLRAVIVVQAFMVAPLVVWAGPIVDLLLGSDYDESVGVLRAMTPFIFLQGLAPLVSLSLNYAGEAKRRLPYVIVAVIINLAIDLALLREIGVVAAAIGTSVAYAVYVGGHVWLCKRLFGLPLAALGLTLARSLAAAAAMGGVLLLFGTSDVSPLEWIAGLTLSSAAFAAGLLALRETTVADARGIIRAARSRMGGRPQ